MPLIWDCLCFTLQICCILRSLNFKGGCCHSTSLYIKNWHATRIKQSLGLPLLVFSTDSHRVICKSVIYLLPPDTHLLLPEGFGSCSASSVFFPGINFSALSKRALSATLRNTFPWASLINWTSCRMSQYKPWAVRHHGKEQIQSAASKEALRVNTFWGASPGHYFPSGCCVIYSSGIWFVGFGWKLIVHSEEGDKEEHYYGTWSAMGYSRWRGIRG